MPKLFNEIKNKFSNNPINLSSTEKKLIAKKNCKNSICVFNFPDPKKNIREDKALISTSKILAFSLAPPSATM